jgi:predicted phage terminase large subunit-like protein
VLFGGAAGPGKSTALLMAALEHVDVPGYAAIIFRRTHAELKLPGGIIPKSLEWLGGPAAQWNGSDYRWTFPSGATLTFGYLGGMRDVGRYQSSEYNLIAFDELTQFDEATYRYMLSRIRRGRGSGVPSRVRAASNPGGIGHEWVKRLFITEGASAGRRYIPATLDDNPHLDVEDYLPRLEQLDPHTREQLLRGDWDAVPDGEFFRRAWWTDPARLRIVPVRDVPPRCQWVRRWDMAATAPAPGKDPDWTVGALVGLDPLGRWWVRDIARMRGGPDEVERFIHETAQRDTRVVPVRMEQEPGSSGVNVINHYARRVLIGYDFRGVRTTGPKVARAGPVASAAERGDVYLVEGDWVSAFLDEASSFPRGAHDDQVDAIAGAFADLGGGAAAAALAAIRKMTGTG